MTPAAIIAVFLFAVAFAYLYLRRVKQREAEERRRKDLADALRQLRQDRER